MNTLKRDLKIALLLGGPGQNGKYPLFPATPFTTPCAGPDSPM